MIAQFRLGGRVALFVKAIGDPAPVTDFTARIRRLNHDASDYLDSAPSIPMTVQFQAAAGQNPAGWHVWLDVAEPQFKAGFYGIDIYPVAGSAPMNTEMAIVRLRKAA